MIRSLLRKLSRRRPDWALPDASDWQLEIISKVQSFTMTSPECIHATINAVEYIVQHDVPGAIVECGVWKGGSMMAAALTLKHLGAERPIYLFDTFEGMTQPATVDVDIHGEAALATYSRIREQPEKAQWCEARIDEVRKNMQSTQHPAHLTHLVEGTVEVTVPGQAPAEIALLRLDTDWYASTRHELEHLYPRVTEHGLIVIDDYGHWAGSRKAVDEYIENHGIRCLLHRIDYSARQFVKTSRN
ncbi:MAG TPA: TylF/MycF/NovP-related O-methyltransferase [Lysobacter sp.]